MCEAINFFDYLIAIRSMGLRYGPSFYPTRDPSRTPKLCLMRPIMMPSYIRQVCLQATQNKTLVNLSPYTTLCPSAETREEFEVLLFAACLGSSAGVD